MTDGWRSPYLDSRLKTIVDLTVCLLVAAPVAVLILFLGLLVFLVDGWPVFFVQKRIGRGGVVFSMPKLRTMSRLTTGTGIRVSRLGLFLRRRRLDELPQILPVLLGRMSLVGPRPELPDVVATYGPRDRKRLAVKPGATGLWQLLGSRRKRIHEELEYDLFYLRKANLLLDLKILLMTVCCMLWSPKVWRSEESPIS